MQSLLAKFIVDKFQQGIFFYFKQTKLHSKTKLHFNGNYILKWKELQLDMVY